MRRLLVLAALALAAALPSAAPAGPAAFMTFWVQWDMAFSGHSQVQTGAGAETGDSRYTQHALCDVHVPIPLPAPSTNNPPALLCLTQTADTWLHSFDRDCLAQCPTVDSVRTGKGGAGFFTWPDPRGTKLATWKNEVQTLFRCWAPPDINAWSTAVVRGADFEAIAQARSRQWALSRDSGLRSKPGCTGRFMWKGMLRISVLRPPRVPPPTPGPTGTTPGSGGGCTAHITSVAFSGGAADPSVAVHGTCLGSRPAPSPAGHPSGLNGCPVVAGDDGYDYGTSLYIAAQSWSGGRYRPSLNETDCIDLVVTKFTSTEVDFHFGPFYTRFYPKFSLDAGATVAVVVNGASANATVKYG
jgi:hypothetical protein